ncbi:MAG: peptidoglycan-binding protein, partial [Chryseobacterium sp.]
MKFRYILIIFIGILVSMSSCKKYRHEEFGKDLAKAFKSKEYKNFDTTAYYTVFKEQLKKEKGTIHHPVWLSKIYDSEEQGLTLIGNFLVNGEIDTLARFLRTSMYHGLDPKYFHSEKIDQLLQQVKETKFKSVEESYPLLAQLEILSADGLINYSNILKYGAINPKNIYGRYYVKVERPDLIDSQKSLDQLELAEFLKEIQPKNGYYQRLQNVLINKAQISNEEREKVYLTMERLRWPTKEYPSKYLLVNIPEFKLRMIEGNKSKLEMSVCVGET